MPQISFLRLDNVSLRYWKSEADQPKSRPLLVFFHGFSFSIDDWLRIGILDHFSKLGYSVLALDLTKGKSSQTTKIRSEDQAEHVSVISAALDSLNPGKARPIIIVGPSMGGALAVEYAIAHPGEVSALVLISPALSEEEDERIVNLEIPVLLVWGERDEVFPVDEYARDLKKRVKLSKLIILKGAGHAAYLDKPEEFRELLEDFLDELS